MRRCPVRLLVLCLFLLVTTIAFADPDTGISSLDFQPKADQRRTVVGDQCDTAIQLVASQSVDVDLCQAWDDYDPGPFGCSPCALPGPEIVARIDAQPGEMIRVTTSILTGAADVRIYLATDCEDPEGSCIAAMAGPTNEFEHAVMAGGEVFLYVDTTGECATVRVSRETPASALSTSFSALKAVYR